MRNRPTLSVKAERGDFGKSAAGSVRGEGAVMAPLPHVDGAIGPAGEVIRKVRMRRHPPDIVETPLQDHVRGLAGRGQM